tara:strand:+ start:1643 stop:2308 length:666 start_codon:yes stop_codon:yes gene_type:complete
MERYNPDKWEYSKYDTELYNFRPLLEEMLGRSDLEKLHNYVDYPELFTLKTEQSTIYHKEFYKKVRGSDFLEKYNHFVENIIKPHFGGDKVVFQKIPTFRTQFLENISVGKWHRDKDYSHSKDEKNFFLSMTDSINTNAVWAESEPNKSDYNPLNSKYGEYIKWDGANCRHGNKKNEEGFTRVSFDFRAMAHSDYIEFERQGKESIHAKVKMVIGEYYEVI